jgi:hypothetical protein
MPLLISGETFWAKPPYYSTLKRNKAAWKFFSDQPPGYRKVMNWWVVSAKREATRLDRLGQANQSFGKARKNQVTATIADERGSRPKSAERLSNVDMSWAYSFAPAERCLLPFTGRFQTISSRHAHCS